MNPGQIEKDREASLAFWGMEPCVFDGTHGAAALAERLHDMETIFRLCHVGAHLQVMLASRRLIEEACAWWLSIGDPKVPKNVWTNFKALITLRYGSLPGEGLHMHYYDPEIYHDMYMSRYVSYLATWRAYPNESMGHYCQRFRDAMLPYIPHDRPMIHTLHILRSGLPLEIMQFTPPATIEMTLDEMMEGVREPVYHGGPFIPEEPIPALPIQEIPPHEEDADMDPVEHPINPKENLENSPVIIIASDDEEGDEDEEQEEDPKEILFGDDDDDWDADSDVFSDVTIE
ncbi:hypothetical protein TIFTF001_016764 [Ficus carica]|uniref:Uncharacterized protein n=1 Tax=Ficus carica TaxID=3494 RepID=A0AA88AB06_FICCA|nr:hypothetical protein TIFTF001_016764 [Ficus carica]